MATSGASMAGMGVMGAYSDMVNLRLFIRLALITVGGAVLLKWLVKFVSERKIYTSMPTVPTTMVLGNLLGHLEIFWNCKTHLPSTLFFYQLALGLTRLFHQENIGMFYFRIGPFRNVAMVVKARTAEVVLSSTKNIVKAVEYDFLKPWLGQGLLTGQGKHWRSHRKMLTPTFHFEILEKFLPTMNSKVSVMIELIERSMKNGKAHIEDIQPYVTNCTVDIICETAMGIKMSGQEEWWAKKNGRPLQNIMPGSEYAAAVNSFLNCMLNRLLSPWMYPDFLFYNLPTGRQQTKYLNLMHTFTNDVIASRKIELESKYDHTASIEENFKNMTSGKRLAFLDLMLGYHFKDPKEMDLVSIREEVDTFMFGGHDTTSTTLHFALLLLGLNIDKQRKVQEELDEIFGYDLEREITLEDTKRMTYLEMAVKEVMRLYPPAVFFARSVSEEYTLEGHRIPVGTTVMVLSYAVHRDPELFDQPERYIPERFEPNSKITKNPFGYIPFSAGARNCIGQRFAMLELKTVMASVLRKYNIRTITKQEDILIDISIITKSKTPIEIEFYHREKA